MIRTTPLGTALATVNDAYDLLSDHHRALRNGETAPQARLTGQAIPHFGTIDAFDRLWIGFLWAHPRFPLTSFSSVYSSTFVRT
jgi:hypothetical protein